MTRTIQLPDFDFSGIYYPEILESLLRYKRLYVPELTDESDEEPSIQLLRAFALVGHLSNTLLDLVANNSYLPTTTLPEALRNQLRLMDYEMLAASPAQVDELYELTAPLEVATEIIPDRAQAATRKEADTGQVYFEALSALVCDPTNVFSYVLGYEDETFVDWTTEANDQTGATTWQPVETPVGGDILYFGHVHAMWNQLTFAFDEGTGLPIGEINVLEFYDGDWQKDFPTSVEYVGGELVFDLSDYLGTQNRQGTNIRVTLNATGVYETVQSTWTGTANVATTGLLGQVSPSEDAADYSVGSDWTEIILDEDTTEGFTQDGDYKFSVPQTVTKNWVKCSVNEIEAYWLRIRAITSSTEGPEFIITRMDGGKQYALSPVTQGQSVTDPPSSSDGLPDQEIELAQENFVWGSQVITVDDEEWEAVDNFLDSAPTAKHYVVKLTDYDKGVIIFGSGEKGKIPPAGTANITKSYRYGANADGNVGANTIVVDKTGLTYIANITNPRQATGWAEAQGASEASMERAKMEGPASIRTKTVAVGPGDVEKMAVAWQDESGLSPFTRAKAFEEGFGPKTMELVLVSAGGGLATQEQLDAITEYFNGNKYSVPPIESHLVANQQVQAVNYSPRSIDIAATVYGNVTAEEVRNQLANYIQPEAVKEDEITYQWNFGSSIPLSQISHIIFGTDKSITKVVLTVPSYEPVLLSRELPILGTVSISVIKP